MGPVKVCYRQYFLHQKFYQTPKTKYIDYSSRELMCTPSKCSISSFFTFSRHLGKSIKNWALLKLLSNILDDIKKFQISKHAGIYVLLTWITICHILRKLQTVVYLWFKVGFSPSKKICFICFNDSPWKMMKNTFYFILRYLNICLDFLGM